MYGIHFATGTQKTTRKSRQSRGFPSCIGLPSNGSNMSKCGCSCNPEVAQQVLKKNQFVWDTVKKPLALLDKLEKKS